LPHSAEKRFTSLASWAKREITSPSPREGAEITVIAFFQAKGQVQIYSVVFLPVTSKFRTSVFVVKLENRHESFRRTWTEPSCLIFFFALFRFSSSFFLRVMSPP
jgi:hypothetical protein